MINPSQYLITKASPMRKFVTKLQKSGAILPVVLLEATVTGGRTYQAYQRDGFVEARERVTEESLGAVFWLFGATMFGKLFDKIGEKFFKIPKKKPDVGRDIVRTSFDNYIERAAKLFKLSPEKAAELKAKLANFSVGKTAASIIMACLFIGYVVPKINQAITKNLFGKMNQADPKHEKAPDFYKNKLTLKDARALFSAKDISINAVENFKASQGTGLSADNQKKSAVQSFKGGWADSALRIVQNFEEKDVWKLLGTDVGTVTGRTANARNNDERVEIMFRDISSIYFYCFSMPAIVAFMNSKDKFGGLNTKLNPMSSMQLHNKIINQMAAKGFEEKVPFKEFEKFALGEKLDKDLYSKFFKGEQFVQKKRFFGLLKPKTVEVVDVINLRDFERIVDENVADKLKAQNLKETARKMSSLMQPKKQGQSILTTFQVKDILQGGFIRDPEVMSELLNDMYKESSLPFKSRMKNLYNRAVNLFRETPIALEQPKINRKQLTNSLKYISIDDINGKRHDILGYVEAIIKDAEKSGEVSAKRMLELNKRNMRKSGLFMGLAMGVSALFLSTIIPKIQYYITYLRTGKNSFPGTENMSPETKKA